MDLYNISRFQNLQQFWRYLLGIQALLPWIFILYIFLQIVILISWIFMVLTFLRTIISISWLFLIRMNPVMMLQTWKISFRAYFKDDITEQWQIRKYSYCVWYIWILRKWGTNLIFIGTWEQGFILDIDIRDNRHICRKNVFIL